MILGKLLPTGASNLYSGKFILIKNVFDTYMKISSDYGDTWSNLSQSFATSILKTAISSDGKYITVGEKINNGKLYVSSDSGASFTLKHTATSEIRGVSMSETGQYQLAGALSAPTLISNDYGQNWTSVGSSISHQDCYVSSSGQYMIISQLSGFPLLSTNYGASFSSIYASTSLDAACISDNGQYILLCITSGYLQLSTDWGANFTQITAAGSRNWKKVRISGSGQYQLAIVDGTSQWWTSSDYGQNWSIGAISSNWSDCSMDKTGKTQYLGNTANGYRVYKSDNWGSSFSPMLNTTTTALWYVTEVCK